MNPAKQMVALVSLALLAAACGASRQPVEPSTPAESEHAQPMPGMSQEENDAMGHPSADDDARSAPPDSGSQSPTSTVPSQDLLDAEQAAYERAQPVFQEHCAMCHTSEGKRSSKGTLKHFSMDTYPFGGHHADEITATIREALGVVGGDATMPKNKPGAVQGEQLALITAWADAFDRAHPAAAQLDVADQRKGDGHAGHDHTH